MLHPDQNNGCLPCQLKGIVAQLRLCQYAQECEGGSLALNISFIELCEIADGHPGYWPDIEGEEVIVECDCPKYPVVARFQFDPNNGDGCAALAWELAESYIAKLKDGKLKPSYAQDGWRQ